ncbi:MAG TPA: FAD-dependent monooxygenase [Hyphomicrobiaceae bacterium]|nr:FAD-dependent monooxygenase [Hyphomicrobiaceae bacterium]
MTAREQTECVVVGGGPAGLAAAAAVAAIGADVCLVAPAAQKGDVRTAALVPASIEFLKNIKAWDGLARLSAPLAGIRIVDDTGGLLRAPEVLFRARDIGGEALGHNVPNAALTAALREAIRASVPIIEDVAEGLEAGTGGITIHLVSGRRIRARLAIAADGRNSRCRQAAKIPVRRWTYEQAAIAASLAHGRSHDDISTEFYRPAGPLTTVPLPGLASSLVWVERTATAARLAALTEASFRAALEGRLQGLLGVVGAIGPRQVFPLSGLLAERMGQDRVALIGEAAHVLPPIGAQGLNLALADAAVLADVLADARRKGGDIGGAGTLEAYHRARARQVAARSMAADALNRSLTLNLLPVDLARGLGLHMLAAFPALRRSLIRRGLEPAAERPRLMRPAVDRPPLAVASSVA